MVVILGEMLFQMVLHVLGLAGEGQTEIFVENVLERVAVLFAEIFRQRVRVVEPDVFHREGVDVPRHVEEERKGVFGGFDVAHVGEPDAVGGGVVSPFQFGVCWIRDWSSFIESWLFRLSGASMVCSVIPRLDISEFNDSKKGRVKVRSLRSDSFFNSSFA